jgi:hypothetical protein
MSLVGRLDKIAATLAEQQPSRKEIVLRRVIIEPIWEMGTDGSAKLVGRRNVHTDELEIVEGWGNESQSLSRR